MAVDSAMEAESRSDENISVGRVARGATLVGLGLAFSALLQFGYVVLLGRHFGAGATGAFAFGFSLAVILATVGQFGAQETLLRYVAAYAGSRDDAHLAGLLRTAWAVGLTGSLVLTIVLYIAADWVAAVAGKPETAMVIEILAFSIPFLAALVLAGATLHGRFRVGRAYLVREGGRAFAPLLAVFLAILLGLSFQDFLVLAVVGFGSLAVIGSILAARALPRIRLGPRYDALRSWISFSCAVVFIDVFRSSFGWIETIFLGFLAEAEMVGVYFAVFRTGLLITLALSAFNGILAPMAAELWQKRDREGLDRTFKLTTRWTLALVVPIGLLLVLLRSEIMSLFGPEFVAGQTVLLVVVVGRMVNGATGGVSRILLMTGHQKMELVNTMVAGMLLIGLLVLLIPRYGALGAAAANATVVSTFSLLRLLQVKRSVGIQPYTKAYFKVILPSVLAYAGGFVLLGWINSISEVTKIGIIVFSFLGLYVITFVAQGLDEEDRRFLSLVSQRLKSGSFRIIHSEPS